MVKLPISDYVANYYKEQGIELTLRQQAALCWHGHYLLKDKLESIKEFLKIFDGDKALNKEIMERIEYEEKSYESFITSDPDCIYAFFDIGGEHSWKYFSSAEAALSYGITYSEDGFNIEKHYLYDKYECVGGKDFDTLIAEYSYTSNGYVISGCTFEYHPFIESAEYFAEFIDYDEDRFENMFLNIKSPFGVGDIVMGKNFGHPCVVSTDHDYFEKVYELHKKDGTAINYEHGNLITVNYIYSNNGKPDYTKVYPFGLWKVDSWEDQDYWEILQMVSKMVKAGVIPVTMNDRIQEYVKNHKGK